MPIHLTSNSRRKFLSSIGAGLVVVATQTGFASEAESNIDGELVYLLNDTHIGEKHPANSARPKNLRMAVSEITKRKTKPAAVLINGDLASHDGQPGDYRHFSKLIQPLRDANVDLHLTMGNHDHRGVFYDVMKEEKPETPIINAKHISVVQTKHANFFLLDTLIETMVTQGEVGESQLQWLAHALDVISNKPAIIVTHHNPRLGGDPNHFPGGLIDSEALWKILKPHKHVKAYIHGHIHDRSYAVHEGIHILNTPAISYVANKKTSTTGWTTARFKTDQLLLTTHTTDPAHPWNSQQKTLKWR